MKKIQFRKQIPNPSSSNSTILTASEITHLLQIYSNSKALAQGKKLHQKIIQNTLHNNHFILTKLIQFYADCDHITYAFKLFDKLPEPNVFAWTAILAHYSRNDMFRNCLWFYGEMRSKAVVPDTYVFPKVLRASAQLQCLHMGALIHKDLIVWASEKDLLVCNSLIDMYSKCEDIECARRVFLDMKEKDLLSWNSLISGYVLNGFPTLAIELFGFMRSKGPEPDIVTLNTVMDAYCRTGKCDEAVRIFAQICKPNIISWTTLISGFSRTGMHEKSLGIFRDMMNIGGVVPDPHCLAIAAASCRYSGSLRNGQEIHAYGLKIHGRSAFYKYCGPALLVMYSQYGRDIYARNVFDLMDKFDVVTWNAIISGFADQDMGHFALQYFTKMQSMGIKYNTITISTILPVCDIESGKLFHTYILRNGFDSNVTVLNALLCVYSKCGCINTAYLVFSTMATRDLVSWNTMIRGFGMHGQGHPALQLLLEMDSAHVQPDSVTFTSAISACSHSGLVDEGLELFHDMSRKYGILPSTEHFSCVVDMLSRAGRLDEVVVLLNEMKMKTSKHMWGTLLAASESEENIEVAKLAAENLVYLEPENAGHYVTLSNIYARGGRWVDAVKVRKLMEDRAFVKPSGTSWTVDET